MMQVQAMQHNSMMKLFALAFNPNLTPEPVPSARLESTVPPRQRPPAIAIARPVPSTKAPVKRDQGMTIPTLSQATQQLATHAATSTLVCASLPNVQDTCSFWVSKCFPNVLFCA
jgi:hypothetical protein